jgi:signal transduction histidine kinase
MTVAATALVAAAMVLASWLFVASVRSSLRENERNESRLVVDRALDELQLRSRRGIAINALPLDSTPGYTVLLLDPDGRIVGGSPGFDSGTFAGVLGSERSPELVDSAGRPFPHAVADERHVWFVGGRMYDFVPLTIRIGDQSTRVYLVATTASDTESSVHTLTTTLWWAIPGLVVLIGVIAWGATGRALRPVETIRAEVTEISHTSLDRRVSEPRARDEVGRLARTMNEMLDRLQNASERQRRFVSDASHELRSPVAAMRATGEVALAHPDAAEWPLVVRRMLTEDDRMEQIVGDLLDLARGEETELPDATVDLDDVALEEVARARRSGVAIQSGAVSAGRVRGSREQLTRVVRNLLDNATRHADATVRIGLGSSTNGAAPVPGGDPSGDPTHGSVVLVVEDDGPGIPREDRERVFERFTRLDEGRARDAGGLGLGLAMVRAIAERHGGTAVVTDPVDPTFPGARVVVTLPGTP